VKAIVWFIGGYLAAQVLARLVMWWAARQVKRDLDRIKSKVINAWVDAAKRGELPGINVKDKE